MKIRFQALLPLRIVEDFRDWTNWLFYRGGIGVKGEESWEAWWEEELVIEFDLYSLSQNVMYCLLTERSTIAPDYPTRVSYGFGTLAFFR